MFLIVCVYQDEDLQTRTGRREREKGSNSERRMYCVCYSLMKNKKKHPHWQEEITCFFSFYWMASSFSRSVVDEPGREKKKKKANE